MSTTLPSDKAVHLFRRAEVRWAQRLHHRKRNDKKGKWHIFWFVFDSSVSLLLLTRRLAVCKELRRCNHLDDQRSRYHIGRFPTTCVCRICGTTIRALFFPLILFVLHFYIQWRCWDTNWIHIYGARHLHPTHRRGHAEIVTSLGMAEDGESTKCCNCTNHVFFN